VKNKPTAINQFAVATAKKVKPNQKIVNKIAHLQANKI
jgi:hypothetical protein